MVQSREEMLKTLGGVTNQEAIVKKMSRKNIQSVRFTIPGGKNLTENLDKQTLPSACYNWLRKVREFKSATIWLAKAGHPIKTKETKVEDFNKSAGGSPWHVSEGGRRWLAEKMSKALFDYHPVAVHARPDGIYVEEDIEKKFSPKSEYWEPWVELMPEKRSQY